MYFELYLVFFKNQGQLSFVDIKQSRARDTALWNSLDSFLLSDLVFEITQVTPLFCR